MGRASRAKKQRRLQNQATPLARTLASYTSNGTIDLLWAAASSPTCVHRLPSLAVAYFEAIVHPPSGTKTPDEAVLAQILDACRTAQPGVAMLEDYVPVDARRAVVFRFSGRIYEIAPNDLERPVAGLRRVLLVARAIDPELRTIRAFGLRDVVSLILRFSDALAKALRVHWTAAEIVPGG